MNYNRYKYYKTTRKEHYEKLIFPQNILSFFALLKNDTDSILINASVKFRRIEFGKNPEFISHKLGLPRYIICDNRFFPLIYFYKNKISNHRAISQFHFFENHFLFGVLTFPNADSSFKTQIKNIILQKYFHKSDISGIGNKQYISLTDNDGNKIMLIQDICFHILYLSSDTEKIFSAHYLKQEQEQKQNEEFKLNKIKNEMKQFL